MFETFFIDVNLERTNSTVMIITPGCAVFDVERELTGMTKQRLMDGGNSYVNFQKKFSKPMLMIFNANLLCSF